MMKRVLITGCGPASVNFILSLKISPERIFVLSTDANPYHLYFSPADKKALVPRALETEEYIRRINELIAQENIEFVHPQPDVEVRVIGENRHRIDAMTFLPSQRAIEICQDKYRSYEVWRKKGLPVPKTMKMRKEKDVERAFEELKPPIWIRAKHGAGGRGSTLANNLETALHWIAYWRARGVSWEFIAQEYLPGRNLAFHSVWKNGELVVSMARERLEYIYPHLSPSGITGTPSIQRTVNDDEVNEMAIEAVLAIDPNFTGIACVDLKEDRDGVPNPTEINAGRMFTTSFFFSFASKLLYGDHRANFPYVYVKLAYGERVPEVKKRNVLPEEIYWIRHIDVPGKIVRSGVVIGEMYLFPGAFQ